MIYKYKFLALMFVIVASTDSFAGTWDKPNSHTITFTGYLEPGESLKFNSLFDDQITDFVITNSGGLVASEGIVIGSRLMKSNVTVTVHGYCMSSCANYLFLAGHKRIIENGIVGYHGDVNACFLGSKESVARAQVRDLLVKAGVTGSALEEQIENFMSETRLEGIAETNYFNSLQVNQKLFSDTCDDNRGYDFLLPTSATFKSFGIDVIGEQDSFLATRESLEKHKILKIN